MDLVAGRKRVPRPAAGISAFLTVNKDTPGKFWNKEITYLIIYDLNYTYFMISFSIVIPKNQNRG
jgi:hypothetical protein